MSVSLRLPEDLSQRLSSLAAQTGRSKTFYMLEAIKQHLDDLEDVYLAERELEAVRAGKSKAVPLEEVMKQYGLADCRCQQKDRSTDATDSAPAGLLHGVHGRASGHEKGAGRSQTDLGDGANGGRRNGCAGVARER